jgi:hypothetical protein
MLLLFEASPLIISFISQFYPSSFRHPSVQTCRLTSGKVFDPLRLLCVEIGLRPNQLEKGCLSGVY